MKRTREENQKVPPPVLRWRDGVAGACAGAFSKTAMAPIERVKLLLQLQGSVVQQQQQPSGGAGHTHTNANTIARQSAWKVAQHVYREEGLLAFWRGNFPNVLRTAGQAGLNFTLMDYYKNVALSPVLQQNVVQRRSKTTEDAERLRQLVVSFVSGGMAGGTATTVLYPVEFLRTRLAMDQGRNLATREYSGMRDVLLKTVRSDGARGLYQGYGIALVGSVLYRLLFLGGYDAVKTELQHMKDTNRSDYHNQNPMTFAERFALAQSISITAGTICYPIDSVRRRLMMQAGKPLEQRRYRGAINCFRIIWAKEGIRGFYLGIAPNLVRSIGGALMLVAYDGFKVVL